MKHQLKPYDLAFEKRDSYLHFRLHALDIDRATVLDYLSEIAQICASQHSRAAIIERDVPILLSGNELRTTWGVFFKMATAMQIAIVNPHSKVAGPLKRLIDHTRGGAVDARYFEDFGSAERWIVPEPGRSTQND